MCVTIHTCVSYIHQSLIHMPTHQMHTDTSQARVPTCCTVCTHMGTHTQATYYMHTFTIHTLPQHTPTHSIHMYLYTHITHNMFIYSSKYAWTHYVYYLKRSQACMYRHMTFTQTQIPQTMCSQCCPYPQAHWGVPHSLILL